MWTTLVLAAAMGLAPNQAGKLTLTKPEFSNGLLGTARKDSKVLPGDSLYLTFDIENLKTDGVGKANYSMGLEMIDAKGKAWFKQDPRPTEAYLSLGGNKIAAVAIAHVGIDLPAGTYTMRVNVQDLTGKSSASIERKFDVLPSGFGIVRLQLSYVGDVPQHLPAPPFGAVGQTIWVNFWVTGFERDTKTKFPDLRAELRVLDEKGKPVHQEPYFGVASKEVNEAFKVVPMQFWLALNRDGKFTVEIKVIDKISKKEAKMTFPMTVLPSR